MLRKPFGSVAALADGWTAKATAAPAATVTAAMARADRRIGAPSGVGVSLLASDDRKVNCQLSMRVLVQVAY
nr:hypothetical protein GCM10020063_019460 [Dactylosporangium thailandense]